MQTQIIIYNKTRSSDKQAGPILCIAHERAEAMVWMWAEASCADRQQGNVKGMHPHNYSAGGVKRLRTLAQKYLSRSTFFYCLKVDWK